MEWKCVWRVLGGWFHGPDIIHLQPHRRESAQTSVNRSSNTVRVTTMTLLVLIELIMEWVVQEVNKNL